MIVERLQDERDAFFLRRVLGGHMGLSAFCSLLTRASGLAKFLVDNLGRYCRSCHFGSELNLSSSLIA